MIYLYGLIDAPAQALAANLDCMIGLEAPFAVAQIGAWQVIYSQHRTREILPKRRLLLKHTKLLEQAQQVGTLLPARFGLAAHSLQQAIDLIQMRREEIGAQFARLAGLVEIGVRIRFPRAQAIAVTLQSHPQLQKQHAALRRASVEDRFALAQFGGQLADALERRRGRAQGKLLSLILPHCQDHVLRAHDEDIDVLKAEFLVAHDTLAAFQDHVIAAAKTVDFASNCEADIAFIGPVPMYHFVNLNLAFQDDEEAA